MSKFSEIKVWPNKKTGSKFLANGSFVYDEAVKVNFQIMEGPNGPFVALPQSSYQKDGKTEYKKEVVVINAEVHKAMTDEVLKAYKSGGTQTTSVATDNLPF